MPFEHLDPHAARLQSYQVADGAAQRGRAAPWVVQVAGLYIDFSKHRMDDAALAAFAHCCDALSLAAKVEGLFAGDALNITEQQRVVHTAYRDRADAVYAGTGVDCMPAVQAAKRCCADMVRKVRSAQWSFPIHDIIHLGFGGSYVGPRFLMQALGSSVDASHRTHVFGSADPVAFQRLLSSCDPRHTLIVLASKSFKTAELHAQWAIAKPWLQVLGDDWPQHVVAITSQAPRAVTMGVLPSHVLPMCQGVGGRFSVWSSMAFVVMCAVSTSVFARFAEGGRQMDHHFRNQPWVRNAPVIAACLSFWYQRYFQVHQHCVVTYNDALMGLSDYAQQLVMESNGKSTRVDGTRVEGDTAPVWFGGQATAAQHSYFQSLHQGTQVVPVDLVAAVGSVADPQHDLLSHCLAQGVALMQGHDDQTSMAKCLPGNRPSTTILMQAILPEQVGALLAFYEHQTLVCSVLWGVNAFDQWGVVAGKRLQSALKQSMGSEDDAHWDASTRSAMDFALSSVPEVVVEG